MIEAIETKQCTKCNETKPVTEFALKNKGKPARRSECKKCAYIRLIPYMKEYRKCYREVTQDPDYKEKQNDKAKVMRIERRQQYVAGKISPPRTKKCKHCGKTKSKASFDLNFNSRNLLRTYCKQCKNKMYRDYLRRKEAS